MSRRRLTRARLVPQPFLALALSLHDRGMQPTLLFHEEYRAMLEVRSRRICRGNTRQSSSTVAGVVIDQGKPPTLLFHEEYQATRKRGNVGERTRAER